MATDSGLHLHFVLDPRSTSWSDLSSLNEGAIARQPERFVGGRNSWIAQTYLRLREPLRERGWKVTTGGSFLPGTVSLVHRDDANRFAATPPSSYLVVVRADRAPVHACDVAICQNNLGLMRHERFIPLWPQPGLLPRDAERGTRIACMAYMGRTSTAPAWFRDAGFHQRLAALGVVFEIRERDWHDCRAIDLAVAARFDAGAVLQTKPATKVYNAWQAGVPMLATPEPAYMEVRRSGLDFLQVHTPDDVLRAIALLREKPELYEAMVRNGLERGREFSVERTRERWLHFLEAEVAPAARFRHSLARPAWYLRAMLRQRSASRMHKWAVARWRASV